MAEKVGGVSADFRKALGKSKDAKKRLTEAKKARPGGFDAPDVPKGNYIVRVTCEADKNSKGNLFVRLNWMIMKGEFAKVAHRMDFTLEGDNEDAVRINWEMLSKAVQVLADIGEEELEDFENWSTDDLCDVLDKINEEAPLVSAYLAPKVDKNKQRRLNIYFNKLLDASEEELDVDMDEEVEEAEEEEEEEEPVKPTRATRTSANGKKPAGKPAPSRRSKVEEEAEEEEEEEAEEEEEEEAEEIAKDDYVFYRPKGKRTDVECLVVTSNKGQQTCTLKEVDDPSKKYVGVAWDKCEKVEEE